MPKIKLKPADVLFSLKIRERDGWKCVRCGGQYEPPTNALQCSHFWGRANKKTRFDPRNCDALCYGCHSLWEGNKQGEYRDFKLKQLGKKEYDDLEKCARMSVKFGESEFKEAHRLLKEGMEYLVRWIKLLK
jgi:hypothetical protein